MQSPVASDDTSALRFRQLDDNLLRAYFALPADARRDRILQVLTAAGIDRSRIRIREDIHDELIGIIYGTMWRRGDLLPGLVKGAIVGGISSCITGALLQWFPLTDNYNGSLSHFGFVCLVGVPMGMAFVMLATGGDNYKRLEIQHAAINRGDLLVMVNLPRRQLGKIRRLMKRENSVYWLGAIDLRYFRKQKKSRSSPKRRSRRDKIA